MQGKGRALVLSFCLCKSVRGRREACIAFGAGEGTWGSWGTLTPASPVTDGLIFKVWPSKLLLNAVVALIRFGSL